MHRGRIFTYLMAIILGCACGIAGAQQPNSLSTSNLIPIAEKGPSNTVIAPCTRNRAVNGLSYVTISSAKQTVNRNDSVIRRVFNVNRRVFAAHTLEAKHQGTDYSVSRVSNAYSLKGPKSSVDVSAAWVLVNNIPWVVQNTSLKIQLAYSADSTTDTMAEAFNSVTSAMPGFSLSTGAAAGIAITQAVDKLLFGNGRSINLLYAHLDLPLLGDPLCDGYYAVFAADNKDSYAKYNGSSVMWDGVDLKYNDAAISDVSYIVIRVRVNERYFSPTMAAFSDATRPWVKPYKTALSEINNLTFINDAQAVKEKENAILSQLVEGRTLLSADNDIIPLEQQEIHNFVRDQSQKAMDNVRKRIASNGVVTRETTREAVMASLVNRSVLVSDVSAAMAKSAIDSPLVVAPASSTGLAEALKSSLERIRSTLE